MDLYIFFFSHVLFVLFPTEGVTGLKELAFLRDLAEQNSVKYGVPDRSALPVVKGSMMVLNQLSNLETTVGRFYINLPNRMIDVASFSLPYSDQMGDGKMRSNSWPKAQVWHVNILSDTPLRSRH